MDFRSVIYECTHPLLSLVRSNRFLIRRLFGVKVPRGIAISFDPTTIALRRAVLKESRDTDRRIFEMGIGQAALVSLSVAASKPLQVSGADCSQARVESSLRVAKCNGIEADFVTSDLFAAVQDKHAFDLIFFNVPYVPSDLGKKMQLTRRLGVDGDQVWDGGSDGTEVLSRFLHEAKDFLTDEGRVVFGVQHVFVPDQRICEVLEETGYRLIQRVEKAFVPACCYIVKPT